jgi:hypothetical protein
MKIKIRDDQELVECVVCEELFEPADDVGRSSDVWLCSDDCADAREIDDNGPANRR